MGTGFSGRHSRRSREVLKFNIGGAMLAHKTGFPIIPVAHNAVTFGRAIVF